MAESLQKARNLDSMYAHAMYNYWYIFLYKRDSSSFSIALCQYLSKGTVDMGIGDTCEIQAANFLFLMCGQYQAWGWILAALNKYFRASAAFSEDSHKKLEGTTSAGQSSPPEGTTTAGQSSPQITSWYKLMALIEHQGSETSGHFVTYRRVDKNSDRWIYTSDMNVREVTAEQVHNRAPYMLFYERYDPLLETT